MAQKVLAYEVATKAGVARDTYKKISFTTEIKNVINDIVSNMDSSSRTKTLRSSGNLSQSVPHGPATVQAWLDQLPKRIKDLAEAGKFTGIVSGGEVANPFVLNKTDIILPKNEAAFNLMIDQISSELAIKLMDQEIPSARSSKVATLTAQRAVQVTASATAQSSYAAGNEGG